MKKATERIRTADLVITNELPTRGYVHLQAYDLLGRRGATLVEAKQLAGCRSVLWEGSAVSSGLYFHNLTARDAGGNQVFSDVKKMLLVK